MSKKPIDLILKRVFQWFCKSVSLQNASWFIWNDSKLRISINWMQIILKPLNLKAVWKPLSAVLSALSFVRSCILWRHWMVSSFSVTWECIEGRSLRGTSAGNSLASGSGVCERVRCIDVGVSVRLCMKWTDGGYCFALASKKSCSLADLMDSLSWGGGGQRTWGGRLSVIGGGGASTCCQYRPSFSPCSSVLIWSPASWSVGPFYLSLVQRCLVKIKHIYLFGSP